MELYPQDRDNQLPYMILGIPFQQRLPQWRVKRSLYTDPWFETPPPT